MIWNFVLTQASSVNRKVLTGIRSSLSLSRTHITQAHPQARQFAKNPRSFVSAQQQSFINYDRLWHFDDRVIKAEFMQFYFGRFCSPDRDCESIRGTLNWRRWRWFAQNWIWQTQKSCFYGFAVYRQTTRLHFDPFMIDESCSEQPLLVSLSPDSMFCIAAN